MFSFIRAILEIFNWKGYQTWKEELRAEHLNQDIERIDMNKSEVNYD